MEVDLSKTPIAMVRLSRKTVTHVFAICLVGCIASACARASLRVTQPLTSRPSTATFSIAEKGSGPIPAQDMSSLRNLFVQQVQRAGVTVASAGAPDAGQIAGEFSSYDPGNRFLRWFIGFGAGS